MAEVTGSSRGSSNNSSVVVGHPEVVEAREVAAGRCVAAFQAVVRRCCRCVARAAFPNSAASQHYPIADIIKTSSMPPLSSLSSMTTAAVVEVGVSAPGSSSSRAALAACHEAAGRWRSASSGLVAVLTTPS